MKPLYPLACWKQIGQPDPLPFEPVSQSRSLIRRQTNSLTLLHLYLPADPIKATSANKKRTDEPLKRGRHHLLLIVNSTYQINSMIFQINKYLKNVDYFSHFYIMKFLKLICKAEKPILWISVQGRYGFCHEDPLESQAWTFGRNKIKYFFQKFILKETRF